MPCGWEGNRRSGVALAMCHGLKWFISLRAHGLDREMSTPPTLSCGVWPIYHLPPIQWIGPGDYVFGLSVRLCVRAYQNKQWVDGSWVNGSNGPVFWIGHMGHGSMHFHSSPTCIFTGSM